MNTKLVSSIDAVARSRLVTINVDALLVDVAKLLSDTQIALVVVCDSDGAMVGVRCAADKDAATRSTRQTRMEIDDRQEEGSDRRVLALLTCAALDRCRARTGKRAHYCRAATLAVPWTE